ncbi:hypothetical protein Tco_1556853 [Tanacetum coccineum]
MEAIQAFLKEYDHIPPNEKCMALLLAEEIFLKIKQAMEEEHNQPEVLQEFASFKPYKPICTFLKESTREKYGYQEKDKNKDKARQNRARDRKEREKTNPTVPSDLIGPARYQIVHGFGSRIEQDASFKEKLTD